jgi:uroporphyrinogen-III synthase
MRENKIEILSTRILDQSQIRKLEQAGISISAMSFIEIEYLKDRTLSAAIKDLAKKPAISVFTSLNAIEAIRDIPGVKKAAWKIFCTGSTTKKLAEEIFGEEAILSVAENAAELADQIVRFNPAGEIQFFCGNQRREELPAILSAHHYKIREWVVYHTSEHPRTIDKEYGAILFFSPSGVRGFYSANQTRAGTVLFAIGETTAREISAFSNNELVISKKSSIENLVDEVICFFKVRASHINND